MRITLAFACFLALGLAGCDTADIKATDAAVGDVMNEDAPMATGASALRGDECTGAVGAVSIETIIVPENARCRLDGTEVDGNVEVRAGAQLLTRGADIDGNVQAQGARNVRLLRSTDVDGNVQLEQGGGVRVIGADIDGSLQVEQNSGPLRLNRNEIGSDLQAFQNTGGVEIQRNRIDGNLQCKENRPAPTGGGNQADSKEDQCAAL